MNLIILFLVVSSNEDNNVNSNGVQKNVEDLIVFLNLLLRKSHTLSQNFNGKNDASLNRIV